MERVVIYRLGSLGDTVVALPCFHRIAETFPNAQRIVLTNTPISSSAPRLMDVLGGSGLVHCSIEYPIAMRSPLSVLHLCRKVRDTGASTLIYLAGPRGRRSLSRDLLFFRLCGINRIIAAPKTSELAGHIIDPDTGYAERESERLARSLFELGSIDLNDAKLWDLRLTSAEYVRASEALKPLRHYQFIALNMGGKTGGNDWGLSNWRALVAGIGSIFKHVGLAFVGGEDDRQRAERIASSLNAPVAILCGKVAPREAAAALKNAVLFIGHDSGALHLAAACGVPTVGLFNNRHPPRIWHPYGPNHFIFQPKEGVEAISVEQVLATIKEVFKRFARH
jgi:heptosyltransferase III